MKFLFLMISLFFSFGAFAQNEGNIWYFGSNAGIDFNSGAAVALDDGALITNEGCATICDANGDLLFYTDGSIVYNTNHVPMPNGTGLSGNSTSTQSAIIVKKPGTTDIYTIFTVSPEGQSPGLQYTEVDMTLDGGLGNVNSVLNVPIYSPTCEKITAITHQNGQDYWIVAEDYTTANFRSYLFNSTGLATTYVSSNADFTPSTTTESIGYIRTNAAGNKLAIATWLGNVVKLYDFNNATGEVSNPITLTADSPYGLEFSPNGQFLYVGLASISGTSGVSQFDISSGVESTIQNSEVQVATATTLVGAVQLAPDEKIYVSVSFQNSISTIENPNGAGLNCNYQNASFPLAPGTTTAYGLPTFYNDILIQNSVSNICFGDSITLTNNTFSTSNWAIASDPSTIISNNTTITVMPDTTTSYVLINGLDSFYYQVNVNLPLPLDLGPDLCDVTSNVILDATYPEVAYLWQDGSTDPTFEVTQSGTYWVQITDSVCTSIDSIFIQFGQVQIFGDEEIYCDSIVNLVVADSNDEVGTWSYLGPPGGINNVVFSPSDSVLDPEITIQELGEYIFIYTSVCGSIDSHTVVFESQAPILNIVAEQECNFSVNLVATNPVQNGYWSATGPAGETITIADINQPVTTADVSNYGEYTFTYTYDFCDANYSAIVDIISVQPQILNTQDIYVCDKTINLSATVPNQVEQWSVVGPGIVTFSDFQSTNTSATVDTYGDYTFYFSGCGQQDTFDVSFTQNAPTINAPEFVECGTEALVEVFYAGDEPGTWSVSPGSIEDIDFTELSDNQISLTTNTYGEAEVTYTICDTSTTVNVVFMCELTIPNVFTPNNNDPNNDFFFIKRLHKTFYDKSVFTVYNRWGVEVYTNGQYGINNSWWKGKDSKFGKDLPEGVYYYVLDVHNKVNNQSENYKGTVHIFR